MIACLGDAAQIGHHQQVSLHRELGVEGGALGKVADIGLDLAGVLEHVEAVDGDRAFVRLQIAGEYLHRRSLASAVGAEQTDDLAGRNAEADTLQRLDGAIRFAHAANVDHSSIS
jgi:hypothetical protein